MQQDMNAAEPVHACLEHVHAGSSYGGAAMEMLTQFGSDSIDFVLVGM